MRKVFMTKVFQNGGSQAIRIPAELRFDSAEVYIWLDETTGSLRLASESPRRMQKFVDLQRELLPRISDEERNRPFNRNQPPPETPKFMLEMGD